MRQYNFLPIKTNKSYGVGLPIKRKNEWGEYKLAGFKDNKPYPDADYLTDDYEDLVSTFEAMTGVKWEDYKKQRNIDNMGKTVAKR